MGEKVEHTSHITQLSVIVKNSLVSGKTYTKSHHHEGNL